ncbi:hypothetical protein FOZ62_015075, partial [Perkinsus olseni]
RRNRSLAGNGGLCDDQVAQLFGHLKGVGDAELFYWLFESRQAPDKSPLVIFFQGGPGASSMYSVTSGNGGPCILNDAGTDTTINKYSFNSFANVMYIDQPAFVGFSEGTPPTNSSDAAKSTLVALEKFFSEHPKYNTEVFLVGQSYAGHYIPALAQEMYAQKSKINLKGVAIGNGLVVPEEQYPFMPLMAYDSETAPSVISEELYQKMLSQVQGCVSQIKTCNNKPWNPVVCKQARDNCLADFVTPLVQMGIDLYDLRLTCPKPPAACRTYKKYETYFNSEKVQDYLQVEATWIFLNTGVYNGFAGDYMLNFGPSLGQLMDATGLRVLIYAGDQDYIGNWLGNRGWSMNLQWGGREGFNKAKDVPYNLPTGQPVGKLRTFTLSATGGQLSFVQVFKASHSAAVDSPEGLLQLLTAFVGNQLR